MKTSTSSNFFRKLFAPLCAAIFLALLVTPANAQTYYDMSSGNYDPAPEN